MQKVLMNLIKKILTDRENLIKISFRQKAKFEGWLKFELALALEEKGMEEVEVEFFDEIERSRSDIKFKSDKIIYEIELKTPNTNFNPLGIFNNKELRPKNITSNISSIIEDICKLRRKVSRREDNTKGIVAFVLFPILDSKNDWMYHIKRIEVEGKVDIINSKKYEEIPIKLSNSKKGKMLVVVFDV